MITKSKHKHLQTRINFHNDVKLDMESGCPIFNMKLDKGVAPFQATRKVLAPIVINPDQIRGSSFVLKGVDHSNSKCLLLAVASSVVVKRELSGCALSDDLQKNSNFLVELRKTMAKNSKQNKSKRENFLKVGLCDSSQDSVGKLAIHCIHQQNTCNSNLKSLQFSSPFKTKISWFVLSNVQMLAGCLDTVMKKSVCSSDHGKVLWAGWKSHSKINMETQKIFTGQNKVLKQSMHETANIADLESGDVTPTHLDRKNAPIELGGPPDSHMNVLHNPNIGLLICLPIGETHLRPVLVQQVQFATTYFYAASLCHGSVHIGTYVEECGKMTNHTVEELLGKTDEIWWKKPHASDRRMFVTCCTRSTIPLIHHTVQGHKLLKMKPRVKKVIRGKGRGQLKSDRIQRAVKTNKATVREKTAEHMFALSKHLSSKMTVKTSAQLI